MRRARASIASLDDLIGPQQQRRWDRKTEGLGGLEIDSEVQLHRPLYRKVGSLCALEDLVDVARCTAQQIDDIWAVAYESPCFCKLREDADRRQTELKREIGKIP